MREGPPDWPLAQSEFIEVRAKRTWRGSQLQVAILGNVIGIDASLYGVAKLTDNGTPTTHLVEVGNDGQLENGFLCSWASTGQAQMG